MENHNHNDINSPKLFFKESIVGAPQAPITNTSKIAGGTYTSNEQAMINELKSTLADIITKLKTLGITL